MDRKRLLNFIMELEKSKAGAEIHRIIIATSVGITLLVAAMLVVLYARYRATLRRNRVIAKPIDELLEARHLPADDSSADGHAADRAEFEAMEQQLWQSKLFVSAGLNRDTIAEACGLSRPRVVRLIKDFTGLTPADYISKLRVDYSVILMRHHPAWTIDAIAEAAGYVRHATFYSHFRRVYGITPAQYRSTRGL